MEHGPVRAAVLPMQLEHHKGAREMRRVRSALRSGLALVPVDAVQAAAPIVGAVAATAAGVVPAGAIPFPTSLPWLPTRNFEQGPDRGRRGGIGHCHVARPGLVGTLSPGSVQLPGPATCDCPPGARFYRPDAVHQTHERAPADLCTYAPWMVGLSGVGLLLALALTTL